jgi:hypothetical protein
MGIIAPREKYKQATAHSSYALADAGRLFFLIGLQKRLYPHRQPQFGQGYRLGQSERF